MIPMTPDHARLIATYTLADYEREIATTKSVIAALPAGQETFAPDGKSMPALKLACHIAGSEWFFMNGVVTGQFARGDMPDSIKSANDVVAWYEENVPPVLAKAKVLSGEDLAKEIDFFGVWKSPAVTFLTLMVKHSIHHRGQLSAYLRPVGGKVPSIYGPSGDTPLPAS